MRIPTDINKLPLGKYIELKATLQKEQDELEKYIDILALLTDKPVIYFEELPGNKLKNHLARLGLLLESKERAKVKSFIWVNGKRYRATKENELSTSQYTAQKTYEADFYNNVHMMCAILFLSNPLFRKPKLDVNNIEKIANDFYKYAKVGQVIGTLFFWLRESEKRNLSSLIYSEQMIQERMKEVMMGFQDLGLDTDGTMSSIRLQAEILLKKMRSEIGTMSDS